MTTIGLSLYAGYRMSSRLEFQFGLDWSTIDYKSTFPGLTPGTTIELDSELEAFTPFAKANFNFMEGPITPFISAGIGWSFIDTNIPDAPPQTGVLVGSVVGLYLRHIPEHEEHGRIYLRRGSRSALGRVAWLLACAWPMKSIGTTRKRARRTSTVSSSESCSSIEHAAGHGTT